MTTSHDGLATVALPQRTGSVRDFDFLVGTWAVHHRTSKTPDKRWIELTSTTCMTPYLGGVMNVEEQLFHARGTRAAAVRTFQRERRQWAIYWIEQDSGTLLPPVYGGFEGDRGEFFGVDDYAGERFLCRFVWTKIDADHARWEQAYSRDGEVWEVNWVMEFSRVANAR